ncbi:MAG: CoB--CoM heterodisulfide reductase iron-sulfur subunit B family protein [Anaerolineae bacterium]|nr:CoB--CoM heterodisulfide reductase iron-sulfur subunit B family protein [Anaerolineae bacterium]
MKYAYYPGCSLHSTGKDYDMSARAICQALDIELQEIPDWICCGASSAHMTSELMSLALPVKDLVAAREMGMDTAVCCAACYSRLKIANKTMSSGEEGLLSQVEELVGSPYRGESKVKHLLEIVIKEYGLDALQEKVSQDLGGLKVAAYYGCLLVRPPEAVDLDDPEVPTLMEQLITALGAQAVEWPYKTECCGASLSLTRTDIVVKLCHDIFEMAVANGADCLMVACPLCQANLDMRQAQVNKRYKTDFALPVFYFTQLIGLALGIDGKTLGLDKLLVSPKKLLSAAAVA